MHASGYLRSIYRTTTDTKSSTAAAASGRGYQVMLSHTSAGIQYMSVDTLLVPLPLYKLGVYKKAPNDLYLTC
jgi:hypothetical protein